MRVYAVFDHSRPYPKGRGAFVAATTALALSALIVAVFYQASLVEDLSGILKYSTRKTYG